MATGPDNDDVIGAFGIWRAPLLWPSRLAGHCGARKREGGKAHDRVFDRLSPVGLNDPDVAEY